MRGEERYILRSVEKLFEGRHLPESSVMFSSCRWCETFYDYSK